jgi:hypothetical protein
VVEKVSGLSFDRALERRIASPLALESSGTRLAGARRRSLATGYWRTPPHVEPRPASGGEARAFEAAAGLISTVRDLLVFQSGHLSGDNRILSELSKREMQRVQWQRSDEPHHGLGWMRWTVDGMSLCGHSGGYPGFNTKIGFAPDLGVAGVTLTNTIGPLADLAIDAVFHVLSRVQALWDASARSTIGGSRKSLERLVGRYRDDWGERVVARVNYGLFLIDPDDDQPMQAPARLEPIADTADWLVAEHDDYGLRGERVSFEQGSAGRSVTLLYGPRRMLRVTGPESSSTSRSVRRPASAAK